MLTSRVAALRANPLGMPIGCQTWPVRTMIAKDFPGTIKTLADAGFQRIELCSPVGYADSGFGGLAKYKGAELRKILGDAGVSCESSHFGIKELRDNLSDRIAWAKDVGMTQMMVPSLDGPQESDDGRCEARGGRIQQDGRAGRQGRHPAGPAQRETSSSRWWTAGGPTTSCSTCWIPKLVKFQFQVSTISQGYDAAEYFTKYPGRFISMHVQDWSTRNEEDDGRRARDTLDWKKIFTAAKTGGVKNYFVEMNLDLMKASVPYLKELNV